MQKVTREELKKISEKVGERRGWDFSSLNTEQEPLPWEYLDVVREYLEPEDRVLDVGTGGGERFLKLADSFSTGVGIDLSPKMIKTANENLPAELEDKIDFMVMDALSLDFERESFDVVTNRHCLISPSEVDKVLKKRGYFISQQVGGENTDNIFKAFGWPSNGDYWEEHWRDKGVLLQSPESWVPEFEKLGYKIVRNESVKVDYWFKDVESLVFWLKAVPTPEDFDVEKHLEGLNRVIEKFQTPKGIKTFEHRHLLVVRKP